MSLYLLRRLLWTIPVLLGVTLLTFAIIQVTPGDPVVLMLGTNAEPDRVAEIRQMLGLNDPLAVQYVRYVANAARGDLGQSIRGNTSVLQEILDRFPSTLQLTVTAMTLATVSGIALGVLAATAHRRWLGTLTMAFSMVGLSIPNFVLGILFVYFFGVQLRWISVTGSDEGFMNLLIPALALALETAASLARLTRSSVIEVIRMDYTRTARAKGLGDRAVVWGHVFRNALIPIVTVIGLRFSLMLTGAVFIEAVFARPGLGRFAINAIQNRDYPQIQGMVLFTAAVYVFVNLAVDLLYGLIDPRIRRH
jgi:ABC-type dipeptide/oligopeptide/nickel transport system permease component